MATTKIHHQKQAVLLSGIPAEVFFSIAEFVCDFSGEITVCSNEEGTIACDGVQYTLDTSTDIRGFLNTCKKARQLIDDYVATFRQQPAVLAFGNPQFFLQTKLEQQLSQGDQRRVRTIDYSWIFFAHVHAYNLSRDGTTALAMPSRHVYQCGIGELYCDSIIAPETNNPIFDIALRHLPTSETILSAAIDLTLFSRLRNIVIDQSQDWFPFHAIVPLLAGTSECNEVLDRCWESAIEIGFHNFYDRNAVLKHRNGDAANVEVLRVQAFEESQKQIEAIFNNELMVFYDTDLLSQLRIYQITFGTWVEIRVLRRFHVLRPTYMTHCTEEGVTYKIEAILTETDGWKVTADVEELPMDEIYWPRPTDESIEDEWYGRSSSEHILRNDEISSQEWMKDVTYNNDSTIDW